VRAVIGDNGENLRGPLVKKSDAGLVAEAVRYFVLDETGYAWPGTRRGQLPSSYKTVFQALDKLIEQGVEMSGLRGRSQTKPEVARRCEELMRARQDEARSLEKHINKLPSPYDINLLVVARHVSKCVSCEGSGIMNCSIARDKLNDVKRAVYEEQLEAEQDRH
jgi:hypothetical protein